jgi:DNA-binding phage protein
MFNPEGGIGNFKGLLQTAGITSEALYKALKPNVTPRFDTINKVCEVQSHFVAKYNQ